MARESVAIDAAVGLRRAEIAALLATAAGLALGQQADFGLRATILSMHLADRLGLPPDERETAYWYALLRFGGCYAENHLLAELVGDEIEFNRRYMPLDAARPGELLPMLFAMIRRANASHGPLALAAAMADGLLHSRASGEAVIRGHCDVAQRLAVRLGFESSIVDALGQARERWDGRGLPQGLSGEAILRPVRLVGLCHDVLLLLPLWGRDGTLAVLGRRSGSSYDPALVTAFAAAADELFAATETADPWQGVMELEPAGTPALDLSQVDDACLVIADFCDLKLPQAISHSRAVAALGETAGHTMGLPPDQVAEIRCAALLHDIGYAALPVRARGGYAVPQGISGEAKLHPFHAEQMLAPIPAFRAAAELIGRHHEACNGTGFFRGVAGPALSPAARVVAAAEAYRTALEGRFGAPPADAAGAAAALRNEVTAGRLDPDAGKAVLAAAGHQVPVKKVDAVAGLTNRELDILRLAATGLSMKEIGARLGISPKTVDNHLQNLYPKIEVKTRSGATLFAIEHGLCSLPK